MVRFEGQISRLRPVLSDESTGAPLEMTSGAEWRLIQHFYHSPGLEDLSIRTVEQ
ncbi:MAG: hypothetical protein ACYS67_18475 [Planctomycetota bacterium]